MGAAPVAAAPRPWGSAPDGAGVTFLETRSWVASPGWRINVTWSAPSADEVTGTPVIMPIGAATWSFTEDDFGAITVTLQRFLYDAKARCALLVDRSGQLVATVGEPPNFDATAFATLTAADFSANDQLARLIGESDFNVLFHQGEKESMYLADIARRVILVVLFDNRTTLGLVRLRMKTAVDELTRIFEGVFARGNARDMAPPGFLAGAEDEIDRLFQ